MSCVEMSLVFQPVSGAEPKLCADSIALFRTTVSETRESACSFMQ